MNGTPGRLYNLCSNDIIYRRPSTETHIPRYGATPTLEQEAPPGEAPPDFVFGAETQLWRLMRHSSVRCTVTWPKLPDDAAVVVVDPIFAKLIAAEKDLVFPFHVWTPIIVERDTEMRTVVVESFALVSPTAI